MPIIGATVPWDQFKLEVAFGSGPFDSAPSWTDITAYWRLSSSTDIERGRQSEQDTVSTGLLSLTLDNTDGRFTVGNTSSPYYPNVKLRKQIRITYTQGGTTYPIFKGYVDEWPVAWPDGGELYAWAQVRASDRFKPLGTPRTLRSVPQEEILAASPLAYYPLGEATGATQAGDISGLGNGFATIAQGGAGGTLTFGTGTGPPTDAASAAQFVAVDTSNGKYLTAPVTAAGGGAGISLTATFNTSTAGVAQSLATAYGGLGSYLQLVIDSSGFIHAYVASGFLMNIVGATVLTDGATHTATVTLGTNMTIYVDGAFVVSAGWGHNIPAPNTLDAGTWRLYDNGLTTPTNIFTGTLSHVALFGTELDSTTATRQQTAMRTGFAGESTGARVGRVADWCGIATGDRVIDTGNTSSVRHVDTTGKTAQGFLQELADTEGGLVFMDTAGKLQFQDRQTRINATAALTLSATSQQVSTGVHFRSNDLLMLNDVTYNREGGITYRATDSTSITSYGSVTTSRETYTTSDAEVRDHANWVIYASKDPIARVEALAVDMLTDSASRIAAIQADLSSKITITNMPGAAPAASTSVFVEGYRETISIDEWTREFNTSPADLYSPLWQLGTAGFSELGQTTRLNF